MDVLRSDQILPVLQPLQIKRVWDAQQKLEQDRLGQEAARKLREQNGTGTEGGELSDRSDYYSESDTSSRSSSEEYRHNSDKGPRPVQGDEQQRSAGLPPALGHSRHEGSNLIHQLQQLLVAHLRIREKERLMGLVFQGVTGEIFKEVIAIFYQPLVKVYKSANVADSLMDVKYFADELITIVEQADGNDGKEESHPAIFICLDRQQIFVY